MKWIRVTRAAPCAICGKPDWCTTSEIGHCCMRVQSDRQLANGGWLHRDSVRRELPRPAPPPPPTLNTTKYMRELSTQKCRRPIKDLASLLGVSPDSLAALSVCWSLKDHAWAFPMRDGYGCMTGVRLRSDDGRKWAVKGSRQGIFMPMRPAKSPVLICEGPTDAAAGLTLGYFSIGRPSCAGGVNEIRVAIKRLGITSIAIVADNDDAGITGAQSLGQSLAAPYIILLLPCKDLRQFIADGGDHMSLGNLIGSTVWKRKQTYALDNTTTQ